MAAVLSSERPIAFSVNIARITGDVKAALFMSQLLYWTRVGVDVELHNGWIFKTREQWDGETGLTRYEQETARACLLEHGLIQEARIGVPARNCYRVQPDVLGTALAELLRAKPVQLTLFDLRSNADQLRALLGRNLAFYRAYRDLTQSTTASVFLTKALAIQRQVAAAQAERDGQGVQATLDMDWFYLSPNQIATETGLTPAQQRDAKQKLCQQLLLDEAVQTHPRRKLFHRVNLTTLAESLRKLLLQKVSTSKPTGLMGAFVKGLSNQRVTVGQANDSVAGRRKLPTVPLRDSRQFPPTLVGPTYGKSPDITVGARNPRTSDEKQALPPISLKKSVSFALSANLVDCNN